MNSLSGYNIVVAVVFSALLLLAASAAAQSPPNLAATSDAQDYDEVIAYMPQAQAEIASVALARLVIALHNAREQAARQLCNGTWTPSGAVVETVGPSLTGYQAKQNAWFYHSLRHVFPLDCGQVSRAQFFVEMSRHLPAWVLLRPAGQEIILSEGAAVGPAAQGRFASR